MASSGRSPSRRGSGPATRARPEVPAGAARDAASTTSGTSSTTPRRRRWRRRLGERRRRCRARGIRSMPALGRRAPASRPSGRGAQGRGPALGCGGHHHGALRARALRPSEARSMQRCVGLEQLIEHRAGRPAGAASGSRAVAHSTSSSSSTGTARVLRARRRHRVVGVLVGDLHRLVALNGCSPTSISYIMMPTA